jgi:hypothetical protein
MPTPAPTPDIATLGALGEIALPYTPGQAMAQCDYRGPRSRGPQRLASVTVQPPTVLLDAEASSRDISRVGWFLELQMNRAQDVFHRDWETVSRSRTQVLGLSSGQAARFAPLTVRHEGGAGDTEVYRVRMVIEWYTRNLELAGNATIVANHYQEAADERIGAWPPYCRGSISRPRT